MLTNPNVSAVQVLNSARSTYYYESTGRSDDTENAPIIDNIFRDNRCVYRSRKNKVVLAKNGHVVSMRTCRIMKCQSLESANAKSRYKVHSAKCNEAPVQNELDRQFDNQEKHAEISSDLPYVRVNYKWH